jgi:hypothetical protein
LKAVLEDGSSLQWVPYNLLDEEMCLAAVKQNGLALEHVPDQLKDKKMCLAAFSSKRNDLHEYLKELKEDELIGPFLKQFQLMFFQYFGTPNEL